MAQEIKEYAIANIAMVEIVTEEDVPKTYRLIDVAEDADAKAYLSQGKEETLRVGDVIKAQNNTEDIVMGYDLKLGSATMVAEILALVDGGTLVYDDLVSTQVKRYDAPAVGTKVKRTPFTTKVYTEEKGGDGDSESYICFEYKNCKGTPVDFTAKNGEFFSPELNIKSRSKLKQSPMSAIFLKELPA